MQRDSTPLTHASFPKACLPSLVTPATPSGGRELTRPGSWHDQGKDPCLQGSDSNGKYKFYAQSALLKNKRCLSFRKSLGKAKHRPLQEDIDRLLRRQHKNLIIKGKIPAPSHALHNSRYHFSLGVSKNVFNKGKGQAGTATPPRVI